MAYTSLTTQPHSRQIARPKPKIFFFLSLPQLALNGTLQPQSLIQIMSVFSSLPKLQIILNESMASLMTGLMRYVIIFRHIQPQMNASRIPKCCMKMIGYNSSKQWKSKYMTTKNVVIGLSCYAKIYLLASKRLWPFGLSNARVFLTVRSINIRLDYVRTEVNKLGDWITGTLMLLLLHGLAFNCCLLLQRFMVLNPRASILFLHSLSQLGCTSLHGASCRHQSQ